MKIKFGTWADFEWLVTVIACGMTLIGLGGCHFCHEEVRGIFLLLGTLPFIGIYAKRLLYWLHERKTCKHTLKHDVEQLEQQLKDNDKISVDPKYIEVLNDERPKRDKFDPFLSKVPVIISRHRWPFVRYNITTPIQKPFYLRHLKWPVKASPKIGE